MSVASNTKQQVTMLMRVICPHCKEKAVIKASNRQSDAVTDLYCRCDSEHCQASFVMTLSHKHDTQPPLNKMQTMLVEILRGMPLEERQQLLAQANP